MPSADEKCPDNRRATVTGRWFWGCAGSEVCCARQMMNPPLLCTHREQHGSSTAPFARSLPLTLALIPNPSSGALHAPDADANHGSQVGTAKLRLTDSETSHSSLPVETTLRL